jgi:hypothetical protein
VLAVVALLAAHSAIYLAQYGFGERFAEAMTAGGHDGWWLPASLVVLGAGAVLLLRTLGALGRLEAMARDVRPAAEPAVPFQPEMLSIWRRLFPIVTVLFAILENVEHLAAHGHVVGIEALVGPEYPLALPVLALVTLGLSALGALVRWRIRVLRTRIAHAAHAARRRPTPETVTPEWQTVGALAPLRFSIDLRDAGRAPPVILPA